jgi:hypothetical protein
MRKIVSFFAVAVLTAALAMPAQADEVTDWNQIMFQLAKVVGTSPLVIDSSNRHCSWFHL